MTFRPTLQHILLAILTLFHDPMLMTLTFSPHNFIHDSKEHHPSIYSCVYINSDLLDKHCHNLHGTVMSIPRINDAMEVFCF